jgi:hypothetical protein
MAITPLNMLLSVPELPYAGSAAPGIAATVSMSSTAIWTGAIVPITKAGSITKIWVYLVNSNVGNVYDLRIESVNASGNPSGTLWAANTQKTGLTGYAAGALLQITLDASATVAINDVIAVVLKPTTYVGASSWGGYSDGGPGDTLPVMTSTTNSGSTWGARSLAPALGLEYSDGSFPRTLNLWPIYAVNSATLNTTSNPRMAGNKITPQVGIRATGMWFWADNDADVRLRLYGADGTTVLWTADFDRDLPYSLAAAMIFTVYFPTAIELSAGQTYYLMVEGLGASVLLYDLQAYNANALSALNSGAVASRVTCASSSPTSPASFTSDTDKQALCGLIFDGIDIPASGGGETSHVFIS